MVYNARTKALLVAVSIALVTVLFLYLMESLSLQALMVVGGTSLLGSCLLLYVALEFLGFREINRIREVLTKLIEKESSGIKLPKSGNVSEEIYSFALKKQKEIDDLKKQESFRKEFIADVSHELKTPIFAAQGFVHTLLDGAVNDKNVRKRFLKKAAKSLDGIDILVQDLLTLSQIETGNIKMRLESIDISRLCTEVIDQFEEKAEKKRIRLRFNSQPKLAAYADWQGITQVVTNLISNAINHTPEGGDVTIWFDIGKKNITTLISDNGEGIPAQHFSRIFERFYRVDKSRSREKGGTGLGLAIVKHILEGHGSQAEVESVVGKGSTFSFKLPRAIGDEGKD